MPSAFFTAHYGNLEFTLCHRSPHWELTLRNRATYTLWIDEQTPIPPNGTYTIARRSRTPSFSLTVAADGAVLSLSVDAMSVTIGDSTLTDFIEVPSRHWRTQSPILPLSVSVYGTARGICTAIQYHNTSATDTITLGDSPLSPGETRTVLGAPWADRCLHDIYASSPTGQTYHVVTHGSSWGVYTRARPL
jgi:hypothetical protein